MWTARAYFESAAVLVVAAFIVAVDVRCTLSKFWRFVDAGPGLLPLVAVAALGVAFLAAGVSCFPAAAVLTSAPGFFSVVLVGVTFVSLRSSSALPLASSLLGLFFSLQSY